ncbi:DUF6114 domain-containing protein [Streptomyces antimicrobicus]|uniref:DUF6114 domain-containing protein n=1 Tax=Streptomyces antimicrobicus TaxID=2883108 RepID=A0ABS8AZT6_9ACTN|nr:DUF6114 domain-containing protein [Streptomyces antimicrobicus]MCB5177871.1 DUF6114 domain-containing protein [Streptomyces antimicrobicus]
MNPQAPVNAADDHWLTVVYYRFHSWTGKRPFWAGLFTLIAGAPIIYFPFGDTRLANVSVTLATTTGSGSLIIGILLITLGLALWFQQAIRVFAGVAAILLGLVSLPLSNLGGWGLGLICALVGGSLALSWAPGRPAAPEAGAPTLAATAAVPAPRETETGYATETTAHADGGRNSAG